MRRGRYAFGLVALTLLLTACAGRDTASPPSAQSPSSPVTGEPTGLIGSWTASGTGVEKGTVLRLAGDGLTVFGGCQVLFGEWIAEPSGLFLADVNGASSARGGGCAASNRPELPAWLARASGFRTEGSVRVLQDDAGAEVARLRPGARPTAGPDLDPSQAVPPTVTDEARRRLAPPAALPATLTPPARESLAGRWVPAAGPAGGPQLAHVVLAADGTWQGSDGCNGTQGRWATGPGGVLLATGGLSTQIGCDNVPVGAWLVTARRVGLDGEVLVLLDAAGTETGRLRRDR